MPRRHGSHVVMVASAITLAALGVGLAAQAPEPGPRLSLDRLALHRRQLVQLALLPPWTTSPPTPSFALVPRG